MTSSELQEWLMAKYGHEKFLPGLDRVKNFLQEEINAVEALKPTIITVAGTNGKGETAMGLAELARSAGIPYVLWTSPHLLSVTERFQNRDGEIEANELENLLLDGEVRRRERNVGLSYYEALWAAFMRWGIRQKASLWILEVGLGGRLDAVNVLNADVVALTSISRDHQEFLGNTYRSILTEKLGVLRSGKILISALELRYLRENVAKHARSLNTSWCDLFEAGVLRREDSFSLRNRRLARETFRMAGFSADELPLSRYAGRGEVWEWEGNLFTFYGSHNPDGMRKMVQFLHASSYNDSKEFFHQIWVAFSQRPPSDLRSMVKMVESLANEETSVFITRFTHPKAATGDGWWRSDEGSQTTFVHEWKDLLSHFKVHKSQRVLVSGSYYFVAEIQSTLRLLGAHPCTRG